MNTLERKLRRKFRVRKQIKSAAAYPRLSVFISLGHIYAQVIDDQKERTLLAVSTLSAELRPSLKGTKNIQAAKAVGELLGKKAAVLGIKKMVFDRGPHHYHGRIKALAEAARAAGVGL